MAASLSPISPRTALPSASTPFADQTVCAALGVEDVSGTRDFVPAGAPIEGVRQIVSRMSPDLLPDVELLDLHLAAADRDEGMTRAERLLERFGGLAGVLAADVTELGWHVSAQSVVNLKLVRELACRSAVAKIAKRQLLSAYTPVAEYFATQMRGLPHEEFWLLFLDRQNQLLLVERHSRGTVDHAPVYTREVLKRALEVGASALIMAHNHPSGDPAPSRPDITMTKTILEAAKAIGVAVHDHMIVGRETVASFKALGLI